jgi:plastocyanin
MKILIIIVVIAILAVGGYYLYKGNYNKSGSSSSNTNIASVSTNSVEIKNMSFNPGDISVASGSVITFTNNDSTNHTVTANDGSFNYSISAGQTITFTIDNPGTYDYHCSIHTSMTGKILVQ